MKLKIGDFFIICIIVFAAVMMLMPGRSTGKRAVLYCDGKEITTFDLSADSEYIFENYLRNKIVVKDGSIFIEDSDCPDKVCVHSGKISKSGQTICCLPNKVLIRVYSDNSETDVISG